MSHRRPPSSQPSRRGSSSQRDYEDYYRDNSNRRSANSGSSPSSNRSSSSRHPVRSQTNRRPGNRPGGRPPNRRRRRRSPLFALFLLLAVLVVIGIIVYAAFFSDSSKETPNYELSFSPSRNLVVGENATVTVADLPEDFDETILWSSSNPEVVSVDKDGNLTAKKAGESTIAAFIGKAKASATVKVVDSVDNVESVTLSHSTLSILSGESFQLTADVVLEEENGSEESSEDTEDSPSVPVIWSSSNTSVARVSNSGLVYAHDVGSATITATVGNQAAVCMVTVHNNPDGEVAKNTEGQQNTEDTESGTTSGDNANQAQPTANGTSKPSPEQTSAESLAAKVTSLALTQDLAYLDVGGNFTLGATVAPSSAKIVWSSDNEKVITVSDQGIVTAKGVGFAVITVSAGSLSSSCTVEVKEAASAGASGATGPGSALEPEPTPSV